MLVVGHRSWPGRTGQSSNKDHVAGMMGRNLPAELTVWLANCYFPDLLVFYSEDDGIYYIYTIYIYVYSIPFGVRPKNHLKCAFLHLCTFWKPKCWPQKIETYPNISQTIPKSCSNFHDLYSVTAKFSENPEAMKNVSMSSHCAGGFLLVPAWCLCPWHTRSAGTISGQSARREGRAGVQLAATYMGVSWNGVPKWIVNGQSYWNGWFGGTPFLGNPLFL